jgi:hypothetical protein
MARTQELPPSASSLILSLRDLGYSLETAVADIIDNSVAAGATRVDIRCDLTLAEPALTILDNGCGMTEAELVTAMRHGGKGPSAARAANDLGRFGLGLKTASFSQCRQLTVVSRAQGETAAAEWDLDAVTAGDSWTISLHDGDELRGIPHFECLPQQGTLVVWRKLDRLFEEEEEHSKAEIVNSKLDVLRDHLSLVFHRFMSGEVGRKKLTITVNGHKLKPFDPFCTSNTATQMLPEEIIKFGGSKVEIQAFILPHHSRLTVEEYEFYKTRSDFISNQGAYVYRNGRLMAWGDWFRLVPKGEATKLGRVRIDFSSALDEAWTIDIKKSRAHPPRKVRLRLGQILTQITGRALRVHKGRGEMLSQETDSPIWERYVDQGLIRYSLNRKHPIITSLMGQLDETGCKTLVALLEAISASLPIDMLYADYSSDPKSFVPKESAESEALDRLRALKLGLFADTEFDPSEFIKLVQSTKLYDDQMPLVERFAKGEVE